MAASDCCLHNPFKFYNSIEFDYKEYQYLKKEIHQIDQNGRLFLMLLSTNFMAKSELVFALTREKASL